MIYWTDSTVRFFLLSSFYFSVLTLAKMAILARIYPNAMVSLGEDHFIHWDLLIDLQLSLRNLISFGHSDLSRISNDLGTFSLYNDDLMEWYTLTSLPLAELECYHHDY